MMFMSLQRRVARVVDFFYTEVEIDLVVERQVRDTIEVWDIVGLLIYYMDFFVLIQYLFGKVGDRFCQIFGLRIQQSLNNKIQTPIPTGMQKQSQSQTLRPPTTPQQPQTPLKISLDQQQLEQQQNAIQQITENPSSRKKSLIIAIVSIIVTVGILAIMMGGSDVEQPDPINAPLQEFTRKAYEQMLKNRPAQYTEVQKAKPYKQLPFCILIKHQLPSQQKQQIISSIHAQKFTNYLIVDQKQPATPSSSPIRLAALAKKIKSQCPDYSILLFVGEPLASNALNITNQYYQVFNMWMGYMSKPGGDGDVEVEVTSMYARILELLDSNDFYGEIQRVASMYGVGDAQFNHFLLTALFELCRFQAKNLPRQSLYSANEYSDGISPPSSGFLTTTIHTSSSPTSPPISRIPFQPLLSLDQDYPVHQRSLLQKRSQFYSSNKTLLILDLLGRVDHQLSHHEFQQVLEFQQLIYMSDNHSLLTLDLLRMEQKYGVGAYGNELPLCVTVFSHNNQQNNRAKKIIRSIARQNYHNFHLVFIDDFSTDLTLSLTISQLSHLGFPKNRTTLVHNLRQKFATYNYINSAFSYCGEGEIQVVMDGDDQLIGFNVLKFVNAQYQANRKGKGKEEGEGDLWLMHTFYKDTRYTEGFNLLPFTNNFVFNIFGGRKFMYFISPLRTWSIRLIRSLPLRQHMSPLTGDWYDTACDVALQYGLFELAGGEAHASYVPEINYLYFTGYGDNDDSTFYKNFRRNVIHFLMTLRSRLKPLASLQEKSSNQEIKEIMKKGLNHDYQTVQF